MLALQEELKNMHFVNISLVNAWHLHTLKLEGFPKSIVHVIISSVSNVQDSTFVLTDIK